MTNIKQTLSIATAVIALAAVPLASAQQAYPTPEAAADALVDAIARHDDAALKVVVGSDYRTYIPERHCRSRRRHQLSRSLGAGAQDRPGRQ